MTNADWIEMLRVIPEEDQNQLVLVLQNGCEVSIDTLYRHEPNFLVARGRVGGTTDEGRAFFIPYDQMLYFRIERITNLAELKDIMDGRAPRKPAEGETPIEGLQPIVATPVVSPAAPLDGSAARNALLDRIRAARATQIASRQMTQ